MLNVITSFFTKKLYDYTGVEIFFMSKDLIDVMDELNGIPCINRGGCGIAALAMYRWIKLNTSYSPEIYFYYSYRDNDY
jgi:hypothetical protein